MGSPAAAARVCRRTGRCQGGAAPGQMLVLELGFFNSRNEALVTHGQPLTSWAFVNYGNKSLDRGPLPLVSAGAGPRATPPAVS